MSGYERQMLREQLERGPDPGEDFFRLKVTGRGETKWLNVSPAILTALIEAIPFPPGYVETIRAKLREDNPHEASGEWSVWDLNQETELEWFNVVEALTLLRAETHGGRYVGGTSGHLYSLPRD